MWLRQPSPVHLRRLLAVLAPLLLVATFLGAQPASAATVDPNASYVLVNRNSGKALDVYNMATNDGARITQWTRNDQNQQQWQFVDSGGASTASSPATRARCWTSTTCPPRTAARSSSGPT